MLLRLMLVLFSIFIGFGTLTALLFICLIAENEELKIKKVMYYSFCCVLIIAFSYVECEIVRCINGVY